ncbi:MAG: hypothetical protein ACHQQS_15860 [Thermoanaerobaculales bacterium]
MRLPPRRFRPALVIAWVFSVLSVVLAVGPNFRGAYDPTLAVLTLTLIAVIWYTYFSYRLANPHLPTVLRVGLTGRGAPADVLLTPELNNDSPNSVSCQITLELWADDAVIPQDDFYSGHVSMPLDPQGVWSGRAKIPRARLPAAPAPQDSPAFKSAKARLTVRWTDQFGEDGISGPVHCYADADTFYNFITLTTEPEIDRRFPRR